MPEPTEFAIDIVDTPPPGTQPCRRGFFAVFALPGGQTLELHIPEAMGIKIGGHSFAVVPSYMLINPDLTIESSGRLRFGEEVCEFLRKR